jgi:Carbohydrate binding module (family 6)
MKSKKHYKSAKSKWWLAKPVLVACLIAAPVSAFAQSDNRVYYNKLVDATSYTSESNPQNDGLVRNMGTKVGYIGNGTSITFREFVIQEDKFPTSLTITYSSAGAGGTVRFVADGYNSSRKLGIPLGEFDLPPTGGWDTFRTVTFPIPANFEFNYLRGIVPLRLEFKNPAASEYLFDVASFKVANASQSPPFAYNKTIDAELFTAESHPGDDSKVRNMGFQVGYIKPDTSITFNDFSIFSATNPSSKIPTSVTITYSSGGDGGTVKIVSDSYNSSRTLGVTIGEFPLPNTGGWDQFRTVTFPVNYDFEFNYLRNAVPMRLEFKNPRSSGYLFNIVDYTISN